MVGQSSVTVAEVLFIETLEFAKARWEIVVHVVPDVFNCSKSPELAFVFKNPWTSVFVCVVDCGAVAANAVVNAPASTSAMLGWHVTVTCHVVVPNPTCAFVYVTKLPGR